MVSGTVAIAIAFILYLDVIIFIGLRNVSKNLSSTDYFLGGRRIGPWVTAISAEAADMSGWLFMAFPAIVYLGGMSQAFWMAIGLIIGTYLNWLFVSKRLRKYTIHVNDSITIPEFLTNRFKDSRHLLSFTSTIFIFIFFTIYTAAGFVACAKLFNLVFAIPYTYALIAGVAMILLYTLLGGYKAVCETNSVQGIIMFFALVVTAIYMILLLGGPIDASVSLLELGHEYLNPFSEQSDLSTIGIISALSWGLGYFGMPHIIVRFMGLRSNFEMSFSRRVAMFWLILVLLAAICIGAFGHLYLMPEVLSDVQAETVFIASVQKMFPAFIAGIFLCGILAASMSTTDSQLMVSSSAFSRDIFKTFLKKNATEKQILLVGRLSTSIIAIIGFIIALNPENSIFNLVRYAWAGFGATFGPIILLSLFWRGATRNGAFAGMITGGITVFIWQQLEGGIFDIYELLPGFIICLVVAIIVSLLNRNKNQEMLNEFDLYRQIVD